MMLFGVAQWFSRSPDSCVTGVPHAAQVASKRNQNEFKSASGLLLAAAVFGG
jgi:hypothetical protein